MEVIGEKVTVIGVVTEFFANEFDGVVADVEQANGSMIRLRIDPETNSFNVANIWDMLVNKKKVTFTATKFGRNYFDAEMTVVH